MNNDTNLMPTNILGETIQVCIVTRDHLRTLEGMTRLGVGPWRIYTYDKQNNTDLMYRGAPEDFAMKLCIAFSGKMMWEVVEPLHGRTIYHEFLNDHGEGIHHVAVDCAGLSWQERLAGYKDRGFDVIQSGSLKGEIPWAYFGTEDAISTTIETFTIPDGFEFPEPESWYPAPPSES